MAANGKLVKMDATIMAAMDHCGPPSAPGGRGGPPEFFSANQSHAVQSEGRRKPRKTSSSKNGAKVTPKPNSSHAAPDTRNILSMGASGGPGMSHPFTSASRKQTNAAPMSSGLSRLAVPACQETPA